MEPVYTLMLYGVATVMIFFIALITAGIIAGTVLMLVSLVGKVRSAQPLSARAAIERSEPAPEALT
jgi:hypothetical protein